MGEHTFGFSNQLSYRSYPDYSPPRSATPLTSPLTCQILSLSISFSCTVTAPFSTSYPPSLVRKAYEGCQVAEASQRMCYLAMDHPTGENCALVRSGVRISDFTTTAVIRVILLSLH